MKKLLLYIFLIIFCAQVNAIAETRVDGGKVDTYKTIKITGRIYNDAFKSFTDADATPSVAGGNLFLTANTGATNVTNFINGVTGEQVVIAFGDSLTTLKHGATINLQGASDYTGISGDTIALVKRGLVWYEIGRAGSIAPTTSKVKVSSLDTTANYLSNKVLSGNDVAFAIGSPGGNETFTANNTSTLETVTTRGASTTVTTEFQNASAIVLGKDETGGTPNIIGSMKFFSAGDNAYYTLLNAATNTENITLTLPTAYPTGITRPLNCTTTGQIGYDTTAYLSSEADTLATVTARGATTAVASSFTGGLIAGTTFQLPNANNPSTTVTGELAYDTNNNALETWNGISSVLIPTVYDKDFVVYGPDSINTTVALFHADSDIYPFGVKLVNVQFDIATAQTYSLGFEEWTGENIKYKANDIVTLSTVTAEDYKEATLAGITDSDIAAGNWVMINIPATAATWIHGKIIYQVKEGN